MATYKNLAYCVRSFCSLALLECACTINDTTVLLFRGRTFIKWLATYKSCIPVWIAMAVLLTARISAAESQNRL